MIAEEGRYSKSLKYYQAYSQAPLKNQQSQSFCLCYSSFSSWGAHLNNLPGVNHHFYIDDPQIRICCPPLFFLDLTLTYLIGLGTSLNPRDPTNSIYPTHTCHFPSICPMFWFHYFCNTILLDEKKQSEKLQTPLESPTGGEIICIPPLKYHLNITSFHVYGLFLNLGFIIFFLDNFYSFFP